MSSPMFSVSCVMGTWRRISITYFSPAHLQLAAGNGFHWQVGADIFETIENTLSHMRLPFFIEIFIIASWGLWCMRNRKIFDAARASINLNSRIKFCYNSTECEKAKFPQFSSGSIPCIFLIPVLLTNQNFSNLNAYAVESSSAVFIQKKNISTV